MATIRLRQRLLEIELQPRTELLISCHGRIVSPRRQRRGVATLRIDLPTQKRLRVRIEAERTGRGATIVEHHVVQAPVDTGRRVVFHPIRGLDRLCGRRVDDERVANCRSATIAERAAIPEQAANIEIGGPLDEAALEDQRINSRGLARIDPQRASVYHGPRGVAVVADNRRTIEQREDASFEIHGGVAIGRAKIEQPVSRTAGAQVQTARLDVDDAIVQQLHTKYCRAEAHLDRAVCVVDKRARARCDIAAIQTQQVAVHERTQVQQRVDAVEDPVVHHVDGQRKVRADCGDPSARVVQELTRANQRKTRGAHVETAGVTQQRAVPQRDIAGQPVERAAGVEASAVYRKRAVDAHPPHGIGDENCAGSAQRAT